MRLLYFNSTHIVPGTNNSVLRLPMPSGGINLSQNKIGLFSLQVPFSWFNVGREYNNNAFSVTLNGTQIQITMPSGSYSLADINAYMQSRLYAAGAYLLDASGNQVYYCSFIVNPTYYRLQLQCKVVPASIPTNYTDPANMYSVYNISSATTMSVNIPTSNINKLIGFDPGTYGSGSVEFTTLGQNSPNVTPVSSVIMRCNAVQNDTQIPADVLYAYSPTVSIGNNIIEKPSNIAFCDCVKSSLQYIEIQMVSDTFAQMQFNDPNMLIGLIIQ